MAWTTPEESKQVAVSWAGPGPALPGMVMCPDQLPSAATARLTKVNCELAPWATPTMAFQPLVAAGITQGPTEWTATTVPTGPLDRSAAKVDAVTVKSSGV